MPAIIFTNVDFPEPFLPIMAKVCWRSREKLTFSTALKSLVPNKRLRPLKVLVKSSTCNNGIIHFLCLQVLMVRSLLFL